MTNPRLAVLRFHGRNARTWYTKGASNSGERFNYLYSKEELAAASSRVGTAICAGTEREPERCSIKETVVHCAAARSIAWATSFTYRWLREE
jgi:hypothetical protein